MHYGVRVFRDRNGAGQRLAEKLAGYRLEDPRILQIALSLRVTHERLQRACFIDYDREMALVAECEQGQNGEREVITVGRLRKIPGTATAEWALLVNDQNQRQGLGSELLRQLIRVARDERLARLTAEILADNLPMQVVARRQGFDLHLDPADPQIVKAEMLLTGAA